MRALPTRRKAVLVAFGCLQNVLVGGIVFGWASVANSLLVAPEEDGGAGLTVDETTSIFVVAASVCFLSSLVLGVVLDKYGPRACSFLSHIIISIGCLIFALASTYSFFNLGAAMMAFGGPGIQNSVVHLANLFPESQFLVLSLVTGCITVSFAVLPLFELLWDQYGIGFRITFGGYVVIALLSAVGSLLLWPDTPFEKEESHKEESLLGTIHEDGFDDVLETQIEQPTPEKEFIESQLEHIHLIEQPLQSHLRSSPHRHIRRGPSFRASVYAIEKGDPSKLSLKDQTFAMQLRSGAYLRTVTVFVSTSFLANFYVASINVELADTQVFTEHEQRRLTSAFTLTLSLGVIFSFFIGWLMDRIGLETCTLLTLVMGQIHQLILILVGSVESMMDVAFVFYTLFRQFLFPVYIACLASRLGFKYFGILSGLGFTMSGIAQSLMTCLVHLTQGTCHVLTSDDCSSGRWIELHVAQLVLLCILGLFPVLDYRAEIQRKHRIQEVLDVANKASSYGAMEFQNDGDIEIFGATTVSHLFDDDSVKNN